LRLEIAPLCGLRPAKEKGLHVRPCSPGIIPANFSGATTARLFYHD
jgi:hypothetical protein